MPTLIRVGRLEMAAFRCADVLSVRDASEHALPDLPYGYAAYVLCPSLALRALTRRTAADPTSRSMSCVSTASSTTSVEMRVVRLDARGARARPTSTSRSSLKFNGDGSNIYFRWRRAHGRRWRERA
jgi:hypothetical protein